MKYNFVFWVLFSAICLVGCEVEEECTGCGIDPRVTVRFDPSLSRKEKEKELSSVVSNMKQLRDSLRLDLPEDLRASLTIRLEVLNTDSTTISQPLQYFKNGKILLNAVSSPDVGPLELWHDTIVNTIKVPVDMQRDSTIYYFNYHAHSDTLEIHYKRDIVQTLTGMRMVLYDIHVDLDNTSFDSLLFKCPSQECSNARASINILL